MDTDGTGKPDLTRESSTEEGPGGTDRNVETSKCRNVETSKCRNQGLGVRGRGLQRRMHAELGATYLWRLLSQTTYLFGLQLRPIFELESRSHMFDSVAKIAQPVVRH